MCFLLLGNEFRTTAFIRKKYKKCAFTQVYGKIYNIETCYTNSNIAVNLRLMLVNFHITFQI